MDNTVEEDTAMRIERLGDLDTGATGVAVLRAVAHAAQRGV